MDSLFGVFSGLWFLLSCALYFMHQEWQFEMACTVVFSLWSLRIHLSKEKGVEVK